MTGVTIERNTSGSRRFVLTLYLTIVAGVGVSLFVAQFLQNPFLITLFFIGAMALMAGSLIFRGRYTLNEEGIKEELFPLYPRFSLVRRKEHFFPWSAVKSYKLDHELNRVYGERWYLRIYFHGTHYNMWIFEGKNEKQTEEFNRVRDYFLEKISGRKEKISDPYVPAGEPSQQAPVIREKSFYTKPAAAWLTAFFACFAVIAVFFLLERLISGQPFTTGFQLAVVKLSVVIIPGVLYMITRIKSARKEEREKGA